MEEENYWLQIEFGLILISVTSYNILLRKTKRKEVVLSARNVHCWL